MDSLSGLGRVIAAPGRNKHETVHDTFDGPLGHGFKVAQFDEGCECFLKVAAKLVIPSEQSLLVLGEDSAGLFDFLLDLGGFDLFVLRSFSGSAGGDVILEQFRVARAGGQGGFGECDAVFLCVLGHVVVLVLLLCLLI